MIPTILQLLQFYFSLHQESFFVNIAVGYEKQNVKQKMNIQWLPAHKCGR